MKRQPLAKALMALAASFMVFGGAQAQKEEDFPTRPVRLLVGYSAGGPTDTITRLIAREMSTSLGQSVVIENKPGANGLIATELLRQAAPDGYTLLVNSLSHNVNPLLDPERVKYDPLKDFTAISRWVTGSQLLVVAANSSFKNLDDLIKEAKARPGEVSYASAGIGSAAHLVTTVLEQYTDTQMNHIPFKGSAPAQTEVMSGRVDFMFGPLVGIAELAQAGKLRILAITAAERNPEFPDVPTIDESGYAGFGEYDQPLGILAPAGVSPAIAQKLDAAIATALSKPEVSERLKSFGLDVSHLGPDAYAAWLVEDRERWSRLIDNSNIRAQIGQ